MKSLAPDPRVRGDVDHAAALPGQVRVGVLRVQQVAAHVDVHHPVVVGQRGIDQPGGDAHAGVVRRHVQPAEMVHRGRHTDAATASGSAASAAVNRAPGPSACSACPPSPGSRPVDQAHPGALGQEPPRHGQAEAGGAAGDQRALPLQQAHGRPV